MSNRIVALSALIGLQENAKKQGANDQDWFIFAWRRCIPVIQRP